MNNVRILGVVALAALLLFFSAGPAAAQEVRYSWLDMSFMGQDVDRTGVQVPLPGQSVEVAGSDGESSATASDASSVSSGPASPGAASTTVVAGSASCPALAMPNYGVESV